MSLEHEGVMTSRATQMDLISQRRCHANYYLGRGSCDDLRLALGARAFSPTREEGNLGVKAPTTTLLGP